MDRRLMVAMLFGATLVSAGCAEHHYRYARYDDTDRVDINSASERQLSRLPGISDEDANRIIANRPYPDTDALVRRGVIGPRKYDEIEDYVFAGGGRRERRDYRDQDERSREYERYYFDEDRYEPR